MTALDTLQKAAPPDSTPPTPGLSPRRVYMARILFLVMNGKAAVWFWPDEIPPLTWNDFVGIAGVFILTVMWISADGHRVGTDGPASTPGS